MILIELFSLLKGNMYVKISLDDDKAALYCGSISRLKKYASYDDYMSLKIKKICFNDRIINIIVSE